MPFLSWLDSALASQRSRRLLEDLYIRQDTAALLEILEDHLSPADCPSLARLVLFAPFASSFSTRAQLVAELTNHQHDANEEQRTVVNGDL